MRRATVLAVILAAFAAAAAVGGTGDGSVTVTLSLSAGKTQYGDRVIATGSVEPAITGEEVVVELGSGESWLEVARTTVFGTGTFTVELVAPEGGLLRARALGSGTASEPVALSVRPKVQVTGEPGVAFLGAKVSARVWPSTYTGRVTITVKRNGEEVAKTFARVANGHLRARVPMPGAGTFSVVLSFPEAPGFAPTFATTRVSAHGRTLSVGSSGPEVGVLRARLAQLRFRVPGPSAAFSWELFDSVIAFQKAYRLPRTGIVGPQTWKALGRAHVLTPRYRSPAHHIEVDKTRQVLLEVTGGNVDAVIPVSSGATGNTPEGKHHILWKSLATTTWLGPAILYRTMDFYENRFAIHGFPSVPAYPASHGCVRIPIWTADWLYNRSPVGETVYVYH